MANVVTQHTGNGKVHARNLNQRARLAKNEIREERKRGRKALTDEEKTPSARFNRVDIAGILVMDFNSKSPFPFTLEHGSRHIHLTVAEAKEVMQFISRRLSHVKLIKRKGE